MARQRSPAIYALAYCHRCRVTLQWSSTYAGRIKGLRCPTCGHYYWRRQTTRYPLAGTVQASAATILPEFVE